MAIYHGVCCKKRSYTGTLCSLWQTEKNSTSDAARQNLCVPALQLHYSSSCRGEITLERELRSTQFCISACSSVEHPKAVFPFSICCPRRGFPVVPRKPEMTTIPLPFPWLNSRGIVTGLTCKRKVRERAGWRSGKYLIDNRGTDIPQHSRTSGEGTPVSASPPTSSARRSKAAARNHVRWPEFRLPLSLHRTHMAASASCDEPRKAYRGAPLPSPPGSLKRP